MDVFCSNQFYSSLCHCYIRSGKEKSSHSSLTVMSSLSHLHYCLNKFPFRAKVFVDLSSSRTKVLRYKNLTVECKYGAFFAKISVTKLALSL